MSTPAYPSWSAPGVAAPHRGLLAAIGLGAATLAFVGAVGSIIWINQPPARAAGTGCLVAGVQEHAVIVVDLTDPVPAGELRAVLAEVGRRAEALPTEARLTLRALAPQDATMAEPLFDRCKPADGSKVKRWTGNEHLEKEHYASAFTEPLQVALGRLRTTDKHERSPIIETLAAVVTDAGFARAHRRSVLLVSDLLEASAICNTYRPGCDFSAIERAGFKPVRDLQRSLAGTEVTVLQIRRTEAGRFQTPAVSTFWRALFDYAEVGEGRLRFERL